MWILLASNLHNWCAVKMLNMTAFSKGGLVNWRLLSPKTVGSKHGRYGIALEKPGKGSTWHTHPKEIVEEDLFYIHKGKGVMVYLQGERASHSIQRRGCNPFSPFDQLYEEHRHGRLWIPFSGAPDPPGTIVMSGDRRNHLVPRTSSNRLLMSLLVPER